LISSNAEEQHPFSNRLKISLYNIAIPKP